MDGGSVWRSLPISGYIHVFFGMLNGKSGDINQLPTVRNDMRILVQDHLFRFHDHRLGDPAMDFHQFISKNE
jgi:hypothetical protein